MSYDIYLTKPKCVTCGHEAGSGHDLPNPTYNLTPIFDLALTGEPYPNEGVSEGAVVLLGTKTDRPRGLRVLSGRTGADSYRMIKAALERLEDPAWRARFVALEPDNGWGDLPGAVRVMRELLDAAHDCPEHVWEIH